MGGALDTCMAGGMQQKATQAINSSGTHRGVGQAKVGHQASGTFRQRWGRRGLKGYWLRAGAGCLPQSSISRWPRASRQRHQGWLMLAAAAAAVRRRGCQLALCAQAPAFRPVLPPVRMASGLAAIAHHSAAGAETQAGSDAAAGRSAHAGAGGWLGRRERRRWLAPRRPARQHSQLLRRLSQRQQGRRQHSVAVGKPNAV